MTAKFWIIFVSFSAEIYFSCVSGLGIFTNKEDVKYFSTYFKTKKSAYLYCIFWRTVFSWIRVQTYRSMFAVTKPLCNTVIWSFSCRLERIESRVTLPSCGRVFQTREENHQAEDLVFLVWRRTKSEHCDQDHYTLVFVILVIFL